MAKEAGKFAIFDYFESETVEVGLVSNIQWESEPCVLNELKEQNGVIRVRWPAKRFKMGGKSKGGVYSAKILNFHGISTNMLTVFALLLTDRSRHSWNTSTDTTDSLSVNAFESGLQMLR